MGTTDHLHLSQSSYTKGMLFRFGMVECNPTVTSMVGAFFSILNAELDKSVIDVKAYEQMVGSFFHGPSQKARHTYGCPRIGPK